MPRFTTETAAAMGRKGGQATMARHGRAHMARIGARGFAATVRKHYGGDRQRYLEVLRERGLLAAADREFVLMLNLYRAHRPDLLEPTRAASGHHFLDG
jgi:general stress protein YciG